MCYYQLHISQGKSIHGWYKNNISKHTSQSRDQMLYTGNIHQRNEQYYHNCTTQFTSLFLGQIVLELISNIESVTFLLWNKNFMEVQFVWQKTSISTTMLPKFTQCLHCWFYRRILASVVHASPVCSFTIGFYSFSTYMW